MKKRKTEFIPDNKKRGEWVELRFMAEAAERDLPASKPFGDSEYFDVVVGRPGKFVGVQVKCTRLRSPHGTGMFARCPAPTRHIGLGHSITLQPTLCPKRHGIFCRKKKLRECGQ